MIKSCALFVVILGVSCVVPNATVALPDDWSYGKEAGPKYSPPDIEPPLLGVSEVERVIILSPEKALIVQANVQIASVNPLPEVPPESVYVFPNVSLQLYVLPFTTPLTFPQITIRLPRVVPGKVILTL